MAKSRLKDENKLDMEELVVHCIHECYECNQKLTQIFTHNKQEKCRHRWESLSAKVRGCKKCYKTENK